MGQASHSTLCYVTIMEPWRGRCVIRLIRGSISCT